MKIKHQQHSCLSSEIVPKIPSKMVRNYSQLASQNRVATVVRFGGDEFVVMLCELDTDKAESAAQAGVIAEKIRTTLANPYVLPVEHEGKKEITIVHHCTASIGVVLFINHEACQDDILKWADKAMYEAKEAGRNGVRFYASNV